MNSTDDKSLPPSKEQAEKLFAQFALLAAKAGWKPTSIQKINNLCEWCLGLSAYAPSSTVAPVAWLVKSDRHGYRQTWLARQDADEDAKNERMAGATVADVVPVYEASPSTISPSNIVSLLAEAVVERIAIEHVIHQARELRLINRWCSVASAGVNAGPGNYLADALDELDKVRLPGPEEKRRG